MKLGIATFAFGEEYRNAVEIGIESKRKYCSRHGYEYISTELPLSNRPHSWDKIPLLKEHIGRFDVIFWSDADVVITNPRKRLETILANYPINPDICFLVSKDAAGNINLGNFFIFRNARTISALDKIWSRSDVIDHAWWENKAFVDLYDSDPSFAELVHVDEKTPNVFNAYCHVGNSATWFKPGDLLMHFAGVRNTGFLKRLMEDTYLRDRQGWDLLRIRLVLRTIFGLPRT